MSTDNVPKIQIEFLIKKILKCFPGTGCTLHNPRLGHHNSSEYHVLPLLNRNKFKAANKKFVL